jgi:ATP-dependent Clp protease ATP-binding subunit ClpA
MKRLNIQLDPARLGRRASELEFNLQQRIVGQAEAIRRIVEIYQSDLANMNDPDKPVGSLLILGPTGSGKTKLAQATAEILTGNPDAVIRIDCGEFQEEGSISKLIGAPPGSYGHDETAPRLTQRELNRCLTRANRLSFVLFDEIEKASNELWNLLLGILDKAALTLGDNSPVDFSRSIIFLVSNLGARKIDSLLYPTIGFASGTARQRNSAGIVATELGEKIARASLEDARRQFKPEFINRIDWTLVLRPLGAPELRDILALELNAVQRRIFSTSCAAPAFIFTLSPAAKDFLLREGTDMRWGARHLLRTVDLCLVRPLSNLIATGQVRQGDHLRIGFSRRLGSLTFSPIQEKLSLTTMACMADPSIMLPHMPARRAFAAAAGSGSSSLAYKRGR